MDPVSSLWKGGKLHHNSTDDDDDDGTELSCLDEMFLSMDDYIWWYISFPN
jgi:hypothetical protein